MFMIIPEIQLYSFGFYFELVVRFAQSQNHSAAHCV